VYTENIKTPLLVVRLCVMHVDVHTWRHVGL